MRHFQGKPWRIRDRMSRFGPVPVRMSIACHMGNGRMEPMDPRRHAPAAARNREPILAVLRDVLPVTGPVLEIASGTGEHAVHFAAALPSFDWQPSAPHASSRESLPPRVGAAGLAHVGGP